MILLSFVTLGLASLSLAVPVPDEADLSVPGAYVLDTYTDHLGIERRSSKAISEELHERLIYYSEWATSAYCGPQQAKGGGKVSCQPSKTCPHVEKSDTKIYKTWLNIGNNSATGFVAADHTRKSIVISMRGSVAFSNWIADIKFFQTKCTDESVVIGPGFCNIGFLGFWQQSRKIAEEALQQGLKENPTYDIIITGHSLGAAAAVYGASYLRQKAEYKNKKVELFSYGQPRAGDEAFSKFVTAQKNNFRVTHTSDAVPKLPPEGGIQAMLGLGKYYHISPEYYIADGVGMKIKNIQVIDSGSSNEGNAGTGQMKFNIIAHIQYFQSNMYYCVLPLPDMGVGYADGTKRTIEMDSATNRTITAIDNKINKILDQRFGPEIWGTSPAKPLGRSSFEPLPVKPIRAR